MSELQLLLQAAGRASRLLIMPHNDPDPDAIAAAMALKYLLSQAAGLETTLVYQGIIGRAENRALVRQLGHPLRPLAQADLARPAQIILVDTQPGAGNNPWTPDMVVAAVIDHHPPRQTAAQAAFVDVRPNMGASATIMLEYLTAAGLPLPPTLATALFYGIKTDTRDLSRGATPTDVAAYFALQPQIDIDMLTEIERAQVPAAYFKNFADTLTSTRLYNRTAITYLGTMNYPDLAAEMADLLARLEKVDWVICLGVFGSQLMLAVRAPGQNGGAGQLVQAIVQQEGTAGGHGSMAGGQIPLKGKNPLHVAAKCKERALKHLNLDPEMAGQSIVR